MVDQINGKIVKIYADVLEHEAAQQFRDAMQQDYVVRGALMADAHTGYSLPIGAVVATKGQIVPAWVGYDIGCGMCAYKTTYKASSVRKNAEKIFEEIYDTVPVGNSMNKRPTKTKLDPLRLTKDAQEIFTKRGGFHALGTLGSGNHFIEIGADSNDVVWIIVHSGSRGVGHGIGSHYMKIASDSDKAKEGHYPLDVNSPEGRAYINDMSWCLEFALENRVVMANRTIAAMDKYIVGKVIGFINRNHNHADYCGDKCSHDFGGPVWIHRKGATHAEAGMMGVIPGNMKDGSFIVKGLGNVESLFSSSHGAGRIMSRRKAKSNIQMEDFSEIMKGITARVTEKTKDESPFAYKNIHDVMKLQEDLVEVVAHVRPIINIKG